MRGIEVGTPAVVMSLGVPFSQARAWFTNNEQQDGAQSAERVSIWFCQHRQQMLGEEDEEVPAIGAGPGPDVSRVRVPTPRVSTARIGMQLPGW